MRTSNFVAVFATLWVCVWTQSQPELSKTVGQEVVTLDDSKLGEFFTTEKTEEGPVVDEKLDESKKNLTADSLIDRVVDLAIKHIKEKTQGPIKLSDEVKQFNRTFLFVPIKGEIILYNGLLNGINTVSRTGKTTWFSKNGVFVNTTVEFEELKFIYDFQTNIYKISTDGVCKGGLTKLVVGVGFQLKIAEREIELTYLKLITAKTLTIQLDSPKFKDKVLNYILKTLTTIFKSVLLTQIEKELQTYIGSVIHFGASLH